VFYNQTESKQSLERPRESLHTKRWVVALVELLHMHSTPGNAQTFFSLDGPRPIPIAEP